MNAPKTAVGHHHDQIAVAPFTNDRGNDVVERFCGSRRFAPGGNIAHQIGNRKPLRLGQCRAEDGREHDFVGRVERLREVVLKDAPAR